MVGEVPDDIAERHKHVEIRQRADDGAPQHRLVADPASKNRFADGSAERDLSD